MVVHCGAIGSSPMDDGPNEPENGVHPNQISMSHQR